jgi:hypothetical protein
MLAAAVLVTPMILAVEPVRLEVPDQTYDHRTQTATMANPDKRIRLAYSRTNSFPPNCRDTHCLDVDSD